MNRIANHASVILVSSSCSLLLYYLVLDHGAVSVGISQGPIISRFSNAIQTGELQVVDKNGDMVAWINGERGVIALFGKDGSKVIMERDAGGVAVRLWGLENRRRGERSHIVLRFDDRDKPMVDLDDGWSEKRIRVDN